MDPRLEPRYSRAEAAELVGVHPSTVAAWLRPRGAKLASFADLLALALAKRFREDHGLPSRKARAAVDELITRFGPLGRRRLWVAPQAVWAELDAAGRERLELATGGQHAFPEVVAHVAQQVELDEAGEAVRWYPLPGSAVIVVDPRVRWGAATIKGTRIPAWALVDAWRAAGGADSPDAVARVARDFEVGADQVDAAVRFAAQGGRSAA